MNAFEPLFRGDLPTGLHDPRSTPVGRLFAGVLAVLALTFVVQGCKPEIGPEAEIRAVVEALELAAEEGRIGDFCDHLAEDYSDDRGNDLASLRAELFFWQQRGSGFTVTTRIVEVVVSTETEASATVIAGVADGPILSADTRGQIRRYELAFTNDGRRWRVRRVASHDSDVVELLGG